MPIYKVFMKCQMENITNIRVSSEDFEYSVKLRCMSCSEVSNKWQVVSSSELISIPGSRGDAHYVVKCKLCSKTNSLSVLTNTQRPYTADDVPTFKQFIAFECRGISIDQFRFGEGWLCDSSESSKKFEDVNMDEEFCDYDDEANCPVGITEIEHQIK